MCHVWSGSGLQPIPDISVAVTGSTGSMLLPLDKISRMTLRDLSTAIATGSNSNHGSCVRCV